MKKINYRDEQGITLILVLWIIMFLGFIAFEFAYSMRSEVTITRNFKEEAESRALAEGGVAMAMAEILRDYTYTAIDSEGNLLLPLKEEGASLGSFMDVTAPNRKDIPLGNGKVSYTIIDENRKIDVNSASSATWRKLLTMTGITDSSEMDTIIDSIEDWKDPNDLHHLNGVEDDYYMSLPKPYHCKNAPFDTVGELLLVKGITPDILFGDKEDGDKRGIANYLTVYTKGSLNLNTAPIEILEISRGQSEAKRIKAVREDRGYYSKYIKSSIFTITATGNVNSVERTIKATGRRTGMGNKAKFEILYWNDNFIGSPLQLNRYLEI